MTAMTKSEQGAPGRFIDLGSPAGQDDIGAQTVIAYVKMTAAQTALGYLLSKCTSTAADGFRFLVTTNGAIVFGSSTSSTALGPEGQTAASIVDTSGTWQHIQATWDGGLTASTGIQIFKDASANLASVFLNGTGTFGSDAANSVFLLNRTGLGREFQGAAGYVARWNRVLSDAERTTVRADGPAAVPSGLIFLWANEQDYGPQALTVSSRSAFVDGGVPTNTAIGDTSSVSFTGTSPVEDMGASGSFTAAGSPITFTGSSPVEDLGASGSFTTSSIGTFTSKAIYNNVGGVITLAASQAVDYVDILHETNATLILRKTGLTTDVNGIFSFTDALIIPGTSYRADFKLSNGTRIMPVKAAT